MTTEERLAVVETQVENLAGAVTEMKTDIKVILAGQAKINETLAQAKGGYRTLLLVGSAAGAAGALIAKLLPFLSLKP